MTTQQDSAPDGEGLGSKPSALPTEQTGKPVVAGHTPGPWTMDRHRQLRGADGEQVGVWDAGISWVSRSPVAEANSRLIAAAPELLEALTDVLNHSGARGNYHALKYADAVEKAEAVLAKALPQQAAVLGSSLREEEG